MIKRTFKKICHNIKHQFRFRPVNFRRISLTLAESVDAWRLFPRLIIAAYGALIFWVSVWYFSISTYQVTKCDAIAIKLMIDNGILIKDAIKYACNVVETTGGPTMAQTTFVSTIIGMAGLIFGMYTNSGRKWDDGLPNDIDNHPKFKAGQITTDAASIPPTQ